MKTLNWSLLWSTQSNLCHSEVFNTGGLFHFQGEAIPFVLSLITTPQRLAAPSPSSGGYFLWISDEGTLNPSALVARRINAPLSRFILITPRNAKESWGCAIEAAQSGLFSWVLFRPSQPCQPSTAVVQTRPFHSLGDLADRLRPYSINKRDLILLGSANALDSIGTSRRRAIWDIQDLPISFGFVNTPLR